MNQIYATRDVWGYFESRTNRYVTCDTRKTVLVLEHFVNPGSWFQDIDGPESWDTFPPYGRSVVILMNEDGCICSTIPLFFQDPHSIILG